MFSSTPFLFNPRVSFKPIEPPIVFPSGTVLTYTGSDVLYTVPAHVVPADKVVGRRWWFKSRCMAIPPASMGGGGGGGYACGSAVQSWTGGNRGTSYVDPSATSVTLTSASGRAQANSGDPDNGGAGLGAAAGNTGESSTSPYLGYKGSNGKIIVSY